VGLVARPVFKTDTTLRNRIPIAFFDGVSHPLDCHKLTYRLSLSLPVSWRSFITFSSTLSACSIHQSELISNS
jgi:hypothetical protein